MKYTLLFIGCCLLFASCCEKQGCQNYAEKSLVFNNFKAGELDSIMLVHYEPNTDFKNALDSFMITATDGYLSYHVINLPKQEYAYKIYVPATGQTYFIDDFRYKRVKDCNGCFPARPKWAYMDEFTSYTLNGKQQYGKFITIEK